jgi:hypothetical protein
MEQAKQQSTAGRSRPRRRLSRRTLIALGLIAVVLVAVRLALPSVLRSVINARLEKIPDYTGHVSRVDVSLYRGAYTLHELVIQKRDGTAKEPYFTARQIDLSLAWRDLFDGQIVGDVALENPTLTLIAGASTEDSQIAADSRWQDAIKDIFPIDITWLKITDGQVRYINHTTKPEVDVRVAHLRALATGLRNRVDQSSGEFPSTIVLEGETMGGGTLKISAQLEPLAIEPHFLAKLELEKVSLPALNEFLRAYGGIDVSKGWFNVYVEGVSRHGHYEGYIKPFFDQVDFSQPKGESRPFKQVVWEWFVSSFATIFKNHPRDEVATRIPFSGEFKNLDMHTWETIKNLLRHAFIHPLAKKLDSQAPGGVGAKDEKGLLPKAPEKPKQ